MAKSPVEPGFSLELDFQLERELQELSRNSEWLQALAVSLVTDWQIAEDLVQTALQAAWTQKNWEPGKLSGWLVGTLRNLSRQYFRTESRRRTREQKVVENAAAWGENLEGAARVPSPAQQMEEVESQKLLLEAIQNLKPTYRRALLLFFQSDLSQAAIAKELQISRRGVETRLRRGRKKLKEFLQARNQQGNWALLLLPLLKRIPPPPLPPPLEVAGPGSLGAGWWASGALALGALGWSLSFLLPPPLFPVSKQSNTFASAAKQEASATSPPLVTAREPASKASGVSVSLDPWPQLQDFLFVEKSSGKPIANLNLHVTFLRNPSFRERQQPENPAFFQPRDRIFWRVGEGSGHSDAGGHVRLQVPEDTDFFAVDLAIHNATHSLENYGQGVRMFQRSATIARPLRFQLVARTGTASGFVLDAQDMPVADALVDVYYDVSPTPGTLPTLTVSTATDGSFQIPHVACDQGGFCLRARKHGFVPLQELRMQRYAGFGVDYPGIHLTLAPGLMRSELRVTDFHNRPVAGAVVRFSFSPIEQSLIPYAFGTYHPSWKLRRLTDENGRLILSNLPQGPLQLRVEHANYLPWQQHLDSVAGNLSVQMDRGNEMQIFVRDAHGPVAGAVVGVFSASLRHTRLTDASGHLVIPALPEGESLYFTVTHPDYACWQSTSMEVGASSSTLVVDLQPGAEIRGHLKMDVAAIDELGAMPRVFVRPLPPTNLPLLAPRSSGRKDGSWWQTVGVDSVSPQADGSFFFRGLPNTDVELWFGMRSRPLGFARTHTGADDVLLSLGDGMADKASVDIHVSEESSGRPIIPYYLYWTREDSTPPTDLPGIVVKNAAGRFHQQGLPPGRYSLSVWAPQGFTTQRISAQNLGPGPHAFEIALASARSLKIRVVDEEGQPLPHAQVAALRADGSFLLQGGMNGKEFRVWSATDRQGQITLSQVPAEHPYRIRCRNEGKDYDFEMPGAQVEAALHTLWVPLAGAQ